MRQKGVRRLFLLKKRLVLAPSRSVSLFLPHTLRGEDGNLGRVLERRGSCDVKREERNGDDDCESCREFHELDDEWEHAPLGIASVVIFLIGHRQ